MSNEQNILKVMKALKKYGVNNEKELEKALKVMKPLNIACMVSPVKGVMANT